MNQQKKPWKTVARIFLMAVPFIVGTLGLFFNGERFTDALFDAACMYTMEYCEPVQNLAVEFARWTAPLASASVIIQIFSVFHTRLHDWRIGHRTEAIAAYGPPEDTAFLERQFPGKVIRKENFDVFQRASRYILLGNDRENLRFYGQNQKLLENCQVYLQSSVWKPQMIHGANLHIFCPEENAARIFWQQSDLYTTYTDHIQSSQEPFSIVLIGFGRLGQELLYWGLLNNLFSPTQQIVYHLFPGVSGIHQDAFASECDRMDAFLAKHHQFDNVSDQIIAHKEPWQMQLSVLENANRILVCTEHCTEELTQDLLFALPLNGVDVFSDEDTLLHQMDEADRVRIFLWRREALKAEHIFQADLLRAAKKINLRYAHLYNGVVETEEQAEIEWNRLNAFTRYSNISAADYHSIQAQMLQTGWHTRRLTDAPPEVLTMFVELEHIRWCRYHYMNNWKWADIPKKDPAHRLHPLLIPFASLSEADKQKDWDNVLLLFSLDDE